MKKIALFTLVVLMICGCSEGGNEIDKQNPKEDTIELSQNKLSFDISREKQSIYVYSSRDWTLTGGAPWCTPSQSDGKDWDEVTFMVMENNEKKERSTTFLFSCGTANETLIITQRHGELIISPSKIEMDATGGEAHIEVKTTFNFEYRIDDSCKEWVMFKDTYGGTATFTVAQNESREQREGQITFYYGEFKETAIIYQAGEELLNITVDVSQKGMLETVLVDYDYAKIESLTITGELGELDFYLIRNRLPQLRNLDISASNINEIPSQAFINSKIEKCILPKGLITIGEKAFYNSLLTSILIPANVETIDQSAFQDCSRLAELKFEQGSKLTIIKGGYTSYNINCYGVFANCSALTSVEIPANVETIEAAAFKGCTQLQVVSFESNSKLKEIGGACSWEPHGAFSNCIALSAIEIPSTVTTIGVAAFYGCSNLQQITFEKPSMLNSLNEGGANSFAMGHSYGTFAKCISLTTIEIPASIERLHNPMFSGCSNLTTISFEKGSKLQYISSDISSAFAQLYKLTTFDASACTQLESIGKKTFSNNPNLTSIIIGAVIPPKCTEQAFGEMNPNCVLKVPSESLSAYKTADGWKTFSSIMGF